MLSKELDEMRVSVANMPANARDKDSSLVNQRVARLSGPEQSDNHLSTRNDKPGARNRDGDRAELPSEPESGTADQNTSTAAHAMLLSRTNPRERELKN